MQKLFNSKLQGGVLNLVLAVSIVIAAILGAILLQVYYRNQMLIKSSIQARLNRNAFSGINYLLALEQEEIHSFETDLFGKQTDSVKLSKEAWGVFDLAMARAKAGKHEVHQAALIGARLDSMREVALYLVDEDRPLFLAGSVAIVGKTFVPQAELKQAHLGQEQEQKTMPVKGKVLKSKSVLPSLYLNALERAGWYTNLKFSPSFQVLSFKSVVAATGQQLKRSFFQEGVLLVSKEQIALRQIALAGQIIVVSDKSVIIDRTAKLEDILVVAPYIEVKAGFSGSLQLFARDSILIQEKCQLQYPSALYVSDGAGTGKLWIEKGAEIAGEVLLGDANKRDSRHVLVLQQNALIHGQVFVDGVVELNGSIEGSLICRRFMLKKAAGLYDNYLADASIRADALSRYYLASPLVSGTAKRGIAKWVR